MDTFGNDFGRFRKFETFLIFLKIFEDSTFHGKLGIKFFRKNHPKTRLDTFGNTFGQFWIFENIFFENFRRLDIPWKLGKNFSKSLPQNLFKTRLDTFGNDFGRFRKFETFLIFLKIFEDSTFHGKLGKNFSKKLSKLQSKHVWILLGTILGVLGNLKLF